MQSNEKDNIDVKRSTWSDQTHDSFLSNEHLGSNEISRYPTSQLTSDGKELMVIPASVTLTSYENNSPNDKRTRQIKSNESSETIANVQCAESSKNYLSEWMSVAPRRPQTIKHPLEFHVIDSGFPKSRKPLMTFHSPVLHEDNMPREQDSGFRLPKNLSKSQTDLGMSRDELLAKAQEEQLKKIILRNRAKDKDATTSLTDLDIARRPAKGKRKPRPEDIVWENDAPRNPSPFSNVIDPPSQVPLSDQPFNPNNNVRQPIPPYSNSVQNVQPNPRSQQLTSHNTHALVPSSIYQNSKDHVLQPDLDVQQSADIKAPPWIPSNTVEPARWASKEELQPVKAKMDTDSNAWGSPIPTDASQASGDSMQALHFGRLFRNKGPSNAEGALRGWDGQIQPPPIDWNDRPRFNNNNPEYKDAFARWMADVRALTTVDPDAYFEPIPHSAVQDLHRHPDGLGFVKRTYTIHENNAKRYGYQDPVEATRYSQKTSAAEFEDWGKLDPSRPENESIKDETTDTLVENWIAHMQQKRNLAEVQKETIKKAREVAQEYKADSNPYRPILNIYLRPAVKIDLPQMRSIYNWYVEHSVRTPELYPVEPSDMRNRWDSCNSNKLPMIVAVMRNKASAKRVQPRVTTESWTTGSPHGSDPQANIMEYEEKIVGWASATDFTASDYVERISTEMELYVDSEHRQKGIGKCLMDKMLEALDRGYVKRGGYPFHCAQELHHLYSPGGGRDLHKIMIVIRKWKHPKDLNGRLMINRGGVSTDVRKLDDRENDYDHWLKDWLESWGFQVEGFLSGIGARSGRFIDDVYLGRETMWQPAEGQIPDPLPNSF